MNERSVIHSDNGVK